MFSAALEAALADISTIFDGFSSPNETGCGRCHLPEETAYLRTPYTRVPPDVSKQYMFEVSDHFDDHTASMRRLLPQAARALADGTLHLAGGWKPLGLSEVDWRRWPAEQAAAVEAFVHAWWEDNLERARPPQPVGDVFEACAGLLGTAVPLRARRPTRISRAASTPGSTTCCATLRRSPGRPPTSRAPSYATCGPGSPPRRPPASSPGLRPRRARRRTRAARAGALGPPAVSP